MKKVQALLVGTRRSHPNKYIPIHMVKRGEEVPVTIDFQNGSILVYCKDDKGIEASCGEVATTAKDPFVTADKLQELFKMYTIEESCDYDAKIVGVHEGVNSKLEITFRGQTAIESVYSRVVKEGILSEEEVELRKQYLEKTSVSQKNVSEIFLTMKKFVNNPRIPAEGFKFINYDGIVESVVASMNAGLNIKLEGMKGIGKNTLIEDIGWLYYRPVYEIQVNAHIDNDTLLGCRTLQAKEENMNKEEVNNCIKILLAAITGQTSDAKIMKELNKTMVEGNTEEAVAAAKTAEFLLDTDFTPLINAIRKKETEVVFQPSVLIKAMEEGGIIVFDELNTGHPSVIALLNSVLDDRRRIQVPGYGLVKAHPNFRVFMTMNRDYQGTFEMNEATESRFAPIVFREPESIVDIIKKNVPAADPSLINKCDKIYREIKKKVRDGRLQARSVNIRGFINACKQSLWDINHKTALINNVANSCPDLSDREAIAQLIDLIEG